MRQTMFTGTKIFQISLSANIFRVSLVSLKWQGRNAKVVSCRRVSFFDSIGFATLTFMELAIMALLTPDRDNV